ncbi:4-alpha-glucanotransferase [Treponema sp. JC4]|uniref:4-alpha-glucanotransferase n=1 Tax=Treponema sp. JC4 TaxID=1124982 RepID=UPI00025B0469|nr:4-alpha-glucanotransferase [Treponema sp. JC4]EID86156.1 4-alpha-glucanotransferase [Treponema sp. JC4]
MAKASTKKLTGIAVPLGALYTKENPVIGEYPDLALFAEFCKKADIDLIQLLPVNDTGTQSSPYSGLSAYALHPIYIRLKDIPEFEALYNSDEKFKKRYDDFIQKFAYTLRYDYDGISKAKEALILSLWATTETYKKGSPDADLAKWISDNDWVKTYAVYKNLKHKYEQASWKAWLKEDQQKTPEEIKKLWNTKAFYKEHLFHAWCQMIADQQFTAATKKVHELGIKIKGDMPILMNDDSCDAWAFPQFFNQNLRAGSPVDNENPTGQNWGFPTYNWKNLKADNYSWWKKRLTLSEKYYDAYRLDHILGFFRIWAIPDTDANAINGHTEPYAALKIEDLYNLGFDDDRIRWLSQPHIPTGVIEDITWNHESAHKILSVFCDKIENEELWRFKKTVKGSQQIYWTDLSAYCNDDAANRIRQKLVDYWSNRTLLEVAKNKFVPLWIYFKSTSWQTLSDREKDSLKKEFDALDAKNEVLWKKQSDEILSALTKSVKMTPCGEDLGVNIECVPVVMEKNGILGLRVIRWTRKWAENGQPYIPFADYTALSVATTSVHDSSTNRQWWNEEKDSAKAFVYENASDFGIAKDWNEAAKLSNEDFTPELAEKIMLSCAKANSMWFISPIQDFLYMEKRYWLDNAADERINIPGSVSKFNWTYRLPIELEELSKDDTLIEKIKTVAKR